MLALAFILGAMLAQARAVRQGVDPNKVLDLVFYILLSGVAGSRLLYVLLNWGFYKNNLSDIVKVWEGGLVFYGGFILAFFVAVWFLKRNRLPVWKITDIISPSFALGIALGRIGCFLNGCCYGALSWRWGVCFPAHDNPPVFAQQVADGLIPASSLWSLPVLPAQLYAAVHGLLIFAVLLFLERYKKYDGFLLWVLVLLYSAGRFFIEGVRYYEQNFMFGAITVSQAISLVLFIIAAAVLAARSRLNA